jgi:hypothetical protein
VITYRKKYGHFAAISNKRRGQGPEKCPFLFFLPFQVFDLRANGELFPRPKIIDAKVAAALKSPRFISAEKQTRQNVPCGPE